MRDYIAFSLGLLERTEDELIKDRLGFRQLLKDLKKREKTPYKDQFLSEMGKLGAAKWREKLNNMTPEEYAKECSKRSLPGKLNGMYGRDRSGEKNPRFGVTLTDETRRKISKNRKRKIHITNGSDNTCIERVEDLPLGWRFGITFNSPPTGGYYVRTEEHRRRNSEQARRKVTCPYCEKVGGISIMKRWHFDMCKKNV